MLDIKDLPELTKEICEEYHRRAMLLPGDSKDVEERRRLRVEIQEKYGVTEVQAINILNGHHIKDYVQIYADKRKPVEEKKKKESKKEKKKEKSDLGQ